MLANFSNEPLVVPKATVLGVAEEISESLVDRINPKCRSKSDTPVKPTGKRKMRLYFASCCKESYISFHRMKDSQVNSFC